MYRELTADILLRQIGLGEDEVPDALILWGKMDFPRLLDQWRALLADPRPLRFFHLLTGTYQGLRIVFGATYGAAMTSEAVHIAGVVGTPLVIQLGSFGGLQRGMHVGDLFFPTVAGRGDGASNCYLPPDEPADASPDLLQWMREEATRRGLTAHQGPHYTTAAMLAETREDIARWNAEGYYGVDLETATTFAVARHFGMRRVAALALIDNLIEDHSILDVTIDQRAVFRRSEQLSAQLALDTVVEWSRPERRLVRPPALLAPQEAHEIEIQLEATGPAQDAL